MRRFSSFAEIYLYQGNIDFRKSINGLCLIVEHELALKPADNALFIFVSKDRAKVKLLYWDQTGFALWYKRLEEQKFILPRMRPQKVILVPARELNLLLDGFDIFTKKPHKKLSYNRFS